MVFADDDNVVGENAKAAVAAMKDGDVVVLQNTRFRKEETKNLEPFSSELASLADVYVNDAFGSAHRAHCSTAGVTDHIKDTAVGYLMSKEIEFLGNAVENPVRPFVAILGGAKVADKLSVIENLLTKVDTLIIGGGMAYTFLKAQGKEVGTSLVDDEKIEYCQNMLKQAEEKGVKLLLPVDTVIATRVPGAYRRRDRCGVCGFWQDPRGQDGPGHRPQDPRAVCRGRKVRQDRGLERPHGRV